MGIHETLCAAGIWADDGERSRLAPEFAVLARRIADRGARTVGFAPGDDDAAVAAIALRIGAALASQRGGHVAVVDALGSWPCAEALAAAARPRAGAYLQPAWLDRGLAVLTARPVPAGISLDQLRLTLGDQTRDFDHVVVDLTGFDHRGEHLDAYALLDAVALVARSGRTQARHLVHRFAELPAERRLGVLLTGM